MKRLFSLILVVAGAATPALALAQEEPSKLPSNKELLQTTLPDFQIGGKPHQDPVKNPVEGDEQAIKQGRMLFNSMNCAGCHAPEGGGGMGPPLSDDQWIYGNRPAEVYLTILQGRPNGMPAFGDVLPPESIWSLVAYVKTLSEDEEQKGN